MASGRPGYGISAGRMSGTASSLYNCVQDAQDKPRDPRAEMQAGLDWLERLQKELPPHNRIPFLLAGHMLELLDGPAGLKWLEIEERNHSGLLEVEELRNALENLTAGLESDKLVDDLIKLADISDLS